MSTENTLKNLARGSQTFHVHRRVIVRSLLERDLGASELGDFLRDKLLAIRPNWRAFMFATKDWAIADRLLVEQRPEIDVRMLHLATAYIEANTASVSRMYQLNDKITGQMLSLEHNIISVPTDALTAEEWQSRFGFQILCASAELSPNEMRIELDKAMASNEWCRARLMYPMINQTVNRTQPEAIDNFLEYFMSGGERASEKAALKLLLHNDAAHRMPFAFKLFVGMMGHPFDACEIILDHFESALACDGKLNASADEALSRLADLMPNTRAADLGALRLTADALPTTSQIASNLAQRCERYGIGNREIELLSNFASLSRFEHEEEALIERPLGILASMRASPYPEPEHFAAMLGAFSVWAFVDGGRVLGALMRSLYMIDRTRQELEGRDVLRLASLLGGVNSFVATAPSAMAVLRRMMPSLVPNIEAMGKLEQHSKHALESVDPDQRLWINRLQWGLRSLEEEGKVQKWLTEVRRQVTVRPLYLSGINWPWVEEIIAQQKLKPFRSFDGAYLLLIAEMESQGDAQRLKLVLDKLLRDLNAVAVLIKEYGDLAPAFVTRYLTTSNLLTSGRADNHFAALNQRIEALETCIRHLGFSGALSRETYENETRVLTTELVLLNVNAGKFEVPWDLFITNAEEKHRDMYETFSNLRPANDDAAISAYVETPWVFRNGHKEEYRYRRNDGVLFQLIVQLIEDFLDHPAFGLEIILSSRFRHNNLLQELNSAITSAGSSAIHPVVPANAIRLSGEYRRVVERTLFQWCSRVLQSRRKDRPDAVFQLIPNSAEVNSILQTAAGSRELRDVISIVVEWIKNRLRPQVEEAGLTFVQQMKRELEGAFAQLLEEQIAGCDNTFRPDDARRVHQAVLDAVLRRVDALQAWFDGVDTQSAAPVSLAQLAQATESLFGNMLPDRELVSEPDLEATAATFEPSEVKVAFDLVREISYNALKHGVQPKVELRIQRVAEPGAVTFVFSNNVDDVVSEGAGQICGTKYDNEDDALTREGNSGRLKIAASAATLLGQDVAIEWVLKEGRYELSVPMRGSSKRVGI